MDGVKNLTKGGTEKPIRQRFPTFTRPQAALLASEISSNGATQPNSLALHYSSHRGSVSVITTTKEMTKKITKKITKKMTKQMTTKMTSLLIW